MISGIFSDKSKMDIIVIVDKRIKYYSRIWGISIFLW